MKVKLLIDNEIIEGVVEIDERFYGGKKVIYQDKEKRMCVISINLVTIVL
jgi:hypothetical protein